jgi:hypothetical protein
VTLEVCLELGRRLQISLKGVMDIQGDVVIYDGHFLLSLSLRVRLCFE